MTGRLVHPTDSTSPLAVVAEGAAAAWGGFRRMDRRSPRCRAPAARPPNTAERPSLGRSRSPARATSTPFTVFTQHTLAFVTQPPAATAANAALTPAVQVAIQDSLGQTVTGATDTVTLVLGSNSTGAILLGTTTVPAVNGVATFSDLRVDRPGAGYVLVASGSRLVAATSTPFSALVSFSAGGAGLAETCA